jgi:hypothetical protein
MPPRDSEDVERREVSRLAARFYIKLRADAPSELCLMALGGKHSGQKKQIACLHSFHIGAERLRWDRELDAKFLQPLLCAGRPRAFTSDSLRFRICIHLSHSAIEIGVRPLTPINAVIQTRRGSLR